MVSYSYLLSDKVHREIYTFYDNVSRKYCHTYSNYLMHQNINDAYDAIYKIENGLLRRKPTISRWAGYHMAHGGKWFFAYRIVNDTIYVEDACHEQNMHD